MIRNDLLVLFKIPVAKVISLSQMSGQALQKKSLKIKLLIASREKSTKSPFSRALVVYSKDSTEKNGPKEGRDGD